MAKPLVIIGHGLAGCVLGLTLYKHGIPFEQYGATLPGESSMASSGLINPITGRRYVKAWNIDEYLRASLDFYRWTELLFHEKFFHEAEIVRFLSNDEAQKAWATRLGDAAYHPYISEKKYDFLEEPGRPYGIVTGAYRLDTPQWLGAAREFLSQKGYLQISNSPVSIDPDKNRIIILATGAVDKTGSHGIIPNKGEALVVRMPDWNVRLIMKDEVYIVPLYEDYYWIGSFYEPWPADPYPSKEGKKQLLNSLQRLYKGEILVVEHLAGIRPTVNDRRPVIGSHPNREGVYLLNGMGTKTTSLAPFWAEQLRLHLVEGLSLPKEVSPLRY